jgi:hypothetical protein
MLKFRCALFLALAVTLAHGAVPTAKPQESFAPYWTAEPGWDTELQLRNNLVAGSLTVTPVLRLVDGAEIPLTPVTISPNSSASIPVSQALLSKAPNLLIQPGIFGSVVFRYTALHARNLAAVSAVHMHGQPIGYHVDAFPVSHDPTAGSMEGIWWQPSPTVKNVMVISNSSDKKIGGVLSLSDASGKQWRDHWSLAPHATQRIDVADLVRKAGLTGRNYGGITFESASFASALDGAHFLYDETSGFSALMNLFDRDPVAKLEERTWAGNKQWTMWAPMLALQTPDPAAGFPGGTVLEPVLFLRNATAKNLSASIQLTWRADSAKGRARLPEVRLKPFETRRLDIGAMQKQLGIPDDAHWAMVTLTSPASPDDLLAIAASYDSTGRYGAQTPFSDNLGAYWAGGQWQVDATHNALVAVTNGGNRATKALLTLHFDDGKKNYEVEQTIQPGDQMWLNFADLIHLSVPDRKGNALPADVTSGTYDLEDLEPGMGGNLIEGKVALDKTWGHLTYGCLTCCGYSTPYLMLDPTLVGVGGGGSIYPYGDNVCTGVKTSLNSYFSATGRWWSGNTGIAQVTAFKGTGVAPGTTNGYASATVPSGDGGRPKPPCPQLVQQGQNQVKVQAVPVNFMLTSASDDGGGSLPLLDVFFSWQSSSGKLSDLSSCSMRENVTYSTVNNSSCPNNNPPQQCYYPPSPPWPGGGQSGTGYPNPTSPTPGQANGGTSEDQNSVTNLNFVKPYGTSSSRRHNMFNICAGLVRGPISMGRLQYQGQCPKMGRANGQ